ncbi:unnamed protein product [Rhizophagus irregularis]|uniref:Uncharacterized protein n=1 Tax=Rhizophagus irregularis TaxID=588596 RepID=A0A915YQ86_9GLOM|nr:unnamed protein product [Rhizophagus irregularis]CAB5311762.1 unnamed protein product [Rhizophagus irregularis]
MLSTKPFKMAQHSNSVMGLLRLNKEGSLKFPKQQIISVFFKNMIQEFSKLKIIQLNQTPQIIFDNDQRLF